MSNRVRVEGKLLAVGAEKFFPKGVSYGTFAPTAAAGQFPSLNQVVDDFAQMRELGVNTVRT
jgi:O-antigen biosynthesis protein